MSAGMASPALQALGAALSTLVLEDPTTVASGLLVAAGKMGFGTALFGLTLGIAGGDFGLYWLGRLAREPVLRRGWIQESSLARAEDWFRMKGLAVLVGARFLPGTRLPVFLAAGTLRVNPLTFLMLAIGTSLVWTLLLLGLAVKLGQAALAHAATWRWPLSLGLVLLVVLLQWGLRKRAERPAPPRVKSAFEFWPPYLFYAPVLLRVVGLTLKHRSFTLPTSANPGIYSGGLILESKSQILELIPDAQRRWVAPWITARAGGPPEVEAALEALKRNGLDFPLVAKPDVGQRGAGVRPLRNAEDWQDYAAQCPPGTHLILQRLVPYDHEAGVFYYRLPGEQAGHIFSVTLKEFPVLVGDGIHDLASLIEQNPRARLQRKVFFQRHAAHLQRVLAEGEPFPLVFAGNHCQGSIFRDGKHLLTPELAARIDGIAAAIPGFFFGRFDLRFRDLAAFQRGEDFQIVELNGASAEATHIWDPNARLGEAYRTLFRQFELLFQIGALNRDLGHRPMRLSTILRDLRAYARLSRNYPQTQ